MFSKILIPALLLAAPSALLAAPTQTHEIVRAPAGKTVTLWRPVKYERTGPTKCHPDSTKSYLCHAANMTHAEKAKAETQFSQR